MRPFFGSTPPLRTALCSHPSHDATAAVRPVIPDFRRDREICWIVNSQSAGLCCRWRFFIQWPLFQCCASSEKLQGRKPNLSFTCTDLISDRWELPSGRFGANGNCGPNLRCVGRDRTDLATAMNPNQSFSQVGNARSKIEFENERKFNSLRPKSPNFHPLWRFWRRYLVPCTLSHRGSLP